MTRKIQALAKVELGKKDIRSKLEEKGKWGSWFRTCNPKFCEQFSTKDLGHFCSWKFLLIRIICGRCVVLNWFANVLFVHKGVCYSFCSFLSKSLEIWTLQWMTQSAITNFLGQFPWSCCWTANRWRCTPRIPRSHLQCAGSNTWESHVQTPQTWEARSPKFWKHFDTDISRTRSLSPWLRGTTGHCSTEEPILPTKRPSRCELYKL